MINYSKKILLEKLKKLTIKLGRYPTQKEINKSQITPHSFSYSKYFKTLDKAFKKLNLKLNPKCKICGMTFISNQALATHLLHKQDLDHISYHRSLKKLEIKKLKDYKHKCNICSKKFETKKGLNDHIFSSNLNDKKHLNLKNKLREKRFRNAKKICIVCNRKIFRNLGGHLTHNYDKKHIGFYKKQKELVIKLFNNLYSFNDMKNFDNILLKGYAPKYFNKICLEGLGKKKVSEISNKIFSIKRKNYWKSLSLNKRKNIMKKVREAEWSRLNSDERKNHPWVVAGRKASLESSKRGSKNQQYAFELLKQKFPNLNWKYNYMIDDGWHIDIAAPEKSIFIEWDGRYHFIKIHSQSYLNNRINRDKIKNRIIIKKLKGCLIRIRDEGRANQKFVEDKINKISALIKNKLPKEKLIKL